MLVYLRTCESAMRHIRVCFMYNCHVHENAMRHIGIALQTRPVMNAQHSISNPTSSTHQHVRALNWEAFAKDLVCLTYRVE